MNNTDTDWFEGVDEVVAEPIKFKLQLAIGEDAYTSLRVKRAAFEAWDALGVAATAATVAKSTAVASTLFPASGFLSAIGIGTAATPVGWVIGAAVVAGGSWIGVTRYLQKKTAERVKTVPEFINTPLDVLGLALFDLMAPLVLKVARADGTYDEQERSVIERWFIREWGFDPEFVRRGLSFSLSRIDDVRIEDIARALAQYKKSCPDCNYEVMTKELLQFLREVSEADGVVDEREELVVEHIGRIFEEEGRLQFGRLAKDLGQKITDNVGVAGSNVAAGANWALSNTISGASQLGRAASEVAGEKIRTGLTSVSKIGTLFSRKRQSSD